MNKPILLFDVSGLAHRSFHGMPYLSNEGSGTTVIYGIMRDILTFADKFDPHAIVFAFDLGDYYRRNHTPSYKCKEKPLQEQTEQDVQRSNLMKELRIQVHQFRMKHLPALGFNNICFREGFEADDIIASVCLDERLKEVEKIIISRDKDFYQLLSKKTSIYDPHEKKTFTKKQFQEKYGIGPKAWPWMLATVGGHDNIQGVKGIGEKTALKYLRAELKEGKAIQSIRVNKELIKRNLELVTLPWVGCPKFEIKEDKIDKAKWVEVTKALGMKDLLNRYPF